MDFVEHILKTGEVWPKSFVEGLLLETLVNDDDEFRLKADWYTHALKIAAFHPEAEAIYDSVCNTVQRSSPKDWDDVPADYRNALTTLSNTKAEASSLSDAVFDRLGKSIELALGQAEETLPQQAKVEE
ncbi:MAG: hypothetical protein IIC88_08110 [Chloroflexi bacterium]|nr:hypothetical protein [Chloroflexota bacterium]